MARAWALARGFLTFVGFAAILQLLVVPIIDVGRVSAQGWSKIGTFNGYICLAKFLDENTGFVGLGISPGKPLNGPVGLYKTTNGGTSWITCVIPGGYGGQIGDLIMVDSLHGWVAMTAYGGGSKALWRTSDAGLTWTETQLGGSGTCVRITPSAMVVTDIFSPGHISTDGGSTWTGSFLSSTNGVEFADPLHGVISDYRGQNWLHTSDGGLTWSNAAMTVESWSVYSDSGTPNYWAAPEGPTNGQPAHAIIYHSTDYGVTWGQLANFPFIFTGHLAGIGGQYLFCQVQDVNNVVGGVTYLGFYYSTDQGVTWTSIGGPLGHNDTRFSVLNGCSGIDVFGFDDLQNGSVYRYSFGSGTGGPATLAVNTETIVQAQCVAIDTAIPLTVTGCGAASARLDSVWLVGSSTFRVADGRSVPRTIKASDNIRLSYQPAGGKFDTVFLHIRYDFGSGLRDTVVRLIGWNTGNPATLSLPFTRETFLRNACVTSVDTTLPLAITGCLPPSATIDSLWIDGSSAFRITGVQSVPRTLHLSDNIPVRYLPGSNSADTGLLHIRYDFGGAVHDTTVTLIGSSASPFAGGRAYQHLAIRSGSLNQMVTMPLMEDISDSTLLKASWGNLNTITATISFDPSKLTYQSYNPPAGWTTGSTVPTANSVQFSITNVSSTPTRPLDMGEAVFKVTDTHAGMTLVQLNDLRLRIGQSDDGVCLNTSEDEMWGIEIVPSSGVSESSSSHSIRIRPNPFGDHIIIADPDHLVSSIEIFDALGRSVASDMVWNNGELHITTSMLPPGAYIVIANSADQVQTFRVTKVQ